MTGVRKTSRSFLLFKFDVNTLHLAEDNDAMQSQAVHLILVYFQYFRKKCLPKINFTVGSIIKIPFPFQIGIMEKKHSNQ